MIVNAIPAGIGDIEEAATHKHAVGRLTKRRRCALDDFLIGNGSFPPVEPVAYDAHRRGAVLNGNQTTVLAIQAIDAIQRILILGRKPADCASLQIEFCYTPDVVGNKDVAAGPQMATVWGDKKSPWSIRTNMPSCTR